MLVWPCKLLLAVASVHCTEAVARPQQSRSRGTATPADLAFLTGRVRIQPKAVPFGLFTTEGTCSTIRNGRVPLAQVAQVAVLCVRSIVGPGSR